MKKINILHIHQDYPDGLSYPSTRAVSNLVEACKAQDQKVGHFVLSINRTSNPFKAKVMPFKDGLAIVYWSIPLPYLYVFSLWLIAKILCKYINQLEFDFIHGHKMTTEGGIAYHLSKRLDLPYVLSIRGGSDVHNLTRFSVHKDFFARVYNGASSVLWVSLWAKKAIEGCIDKPIKNLTPFPNICVIDIKDNSIYEGKRLHYITAVAFHQYKRKGIIPLVRAISVLKEKGLYIYLDIYGSGPQVDIDTVKKEISNLELNKQIVLKGHVSQEQLRANMSDSKAFVMPSINESFGMSYIEALSVGCPIIYMAATGIDGYFENFEVGYKLKDQSLENIVEAFEVLEESNQKIVSNIKKMSDEKYLEMFTGESVARFYLSKVVSQLAVLTEVV